jgi:peptide/nickel transport system substrate-binding protein
MVGTFCTSTQQGEIFVSRYYASAGGLAAVGAALLIAGCGGSSGAASSSSASKPAAKIVARTASGCPKHSKAAGTIKYSDWQFPDTLNPYQTTEAVSYETLNGMFDSLFLYNSKAKILPQMATAVPSTTNGGVNNNGKTIVIHLKQGLRWSDGAEITSKDVKFGWQVSMDPATGPYCTGSCDVISSINTPDPFTAVLHLKRAYSASVASWMPLVWPHIWKGAWNNSPHAAAVKLAQNPGFNFEGTSFPTNGPYQVTEFSKDDRIVLQPMKYYSGMNCGGAVKSLIFAFYASKQGMIAGAANGNTDITQDYTTDDLKALTNNSKGAFSIHSDPGFIFEHFEFNVDPTYNGKPNPLANTTVREALALSLDKMGLIQNALGLKGQAAKNVIAWTPWVNTPTLKQPYADTKITGEWDPISSKYVMPGTAQAVADAKKLLARTPYKNGFNTSISTTTGNPTRTAELEVAANNWNKIGVHVTPNYVPATTFFAGWSQAGPLNHGQFQIALFTFSGSPEPDSFKYNLESRYIDRNATTHVAINENYSGIKNPTIDKELTAASSTFNQAQRAKDYATVQEQLNRNVYWISLYFRPQIATANTNVGNFSNNPTQLGPTWNMYQWKALKAS